MTRVRKAAAVGLMTPMAVAAMTVGVSEPADADLCPPLASASIQAPTGAVTAGSSVHVSAQINGVMLLKAHLQISGPGLDEQVGPSVMSGPIQGDVTVSKAGYFTLAVVGNGTKCTYQTTGFSVKDRLSASKPTNHSKPGKTSGASGGSSGGGGALPSGSPGSGNAGGNNYPLMPLNSASPFSLPSVAPDGTGTGFVYPTPEPEVASPPSRPVARNVSQTTPIKWGQSLALALVLLVISAHLGMWSRRQRLAAEGAHTTRKNRRAPRKGEAAAFTAEPASPAEPKASARTDTAQAGAPTGTPAPGGAEMPGNAAMPLRTDLPVAETPGGAHVQSGTGLLRGETPGGADTRSGAETPGGADIQSGADIEGGADTRGGADMTGGGGSSGRGYRGRRRRS
ncbi:MAG: hypothetical protein ACJ768_16590 [Gaiellaceae bacterium]